MKTRAKALSLLTNYACSAWNANYYFFSHICGLFKNFNIFANNNNMLNHERVGGESGLLLNMGSAVLALQTQRPGELISAWSHWRCLFRHWMLTWKWPIWGVHSVSIGRMRQLGQCPARWERDTISASFVPFVWTPGMEEKHAVAFATHSQCCESATDSLAWFS